MQSSPTLPMAIVDSSAQTGSDIEAAAARLVNECMTKIYMYLISMDVAEVKIPEYLASSAFGSKVVAKAMQAFEDSKYLCYWSQGKLVFLWKRNWDSTC